MHRISRAAIAVLLFALPAAAQSTTSTSTDDSFTWSGKMANGAWLRVYDLNGSIRVERATGDVAEVTGEKDWHRGDPKDVRFVMVKDGDNVVICALWGDDSKCDARGAHMGRGHHDNGDNHNDVSVKFVVRLPKGVKIDLNTVNGGLDVNGAQSEMEASTVNGRIEIATTSGPVNAHTVNGSINVRMDALSGGDDLEFSTVNGSVSVAVPSDFAGELVMETVNGSLLTDFPLLITGKVNPRHIKATIGKGGRRVEMKTVNGSIELRKAS